MVEDSVVIVVEEETIKVDWKMRELRLTRYIRKFVINYEHFFAYFGLHCGKPRELGT